MQWKVSLRSTESEAVSWSGNLVRRFSDSLKAEISEGQSSWRRFELYTKGVISVLLTTLRKQLTMLIKSWIALTCLWLTLSTGFHPLNLHSLCIAMGVFSFDSSLLALFASDHISRALQAIMHSLTHSEEWAYFFLSPLGGVCDRLNRGPPSALRNYNLSANRKRIRTLSWLSALRMNTILPYFIWIHSTPQQIHFGVKWWIVTPNNESYEI